VLEERGALDTSQMILSGYLGSPEIAAVVAAVAPKPVNVLALPGMRVAELAELGVRRISVGGGLARAAWGGFLRAAREIAEAGTFTALGEAPPGRDLDAFFTADLERRP